MRPYPNKTGVDVTDELVRQVRCTRCNILHMFVLSFIFLMTVVSELIVAATAAIVAVSGSSQSCCLAL